MRSVHFPWRWHSRPWWAPRARLEVEILEGRLAPAAHTWSGGGGLMNPNWSNPANWSSHIAPVSGETVDLTFPTGAGNLANTDDVPNLIVHSIKFSGGNYSVSGGAGVALTLEGGSLIQNMTGANALLPNLPIQLSSADTNPIHTLDVAANTSLLLAGLLGGSPNSQLVKTSGGPLTLASNSNLAGLQTRVVAGTLLVDGGQPTNTMTVSGGAVLGGRGLVQGITIQPGGIVSPGNPVTNPGLLRAMGNVTFQSTPMTPSIFVAQLNGTTAGSGYDQLSGNGTVNLGGAALSASLSFASAVGDTFTIVTTAGSLGGTFHNLPNGATILIGGKTFQIHYTANAAILTHIPGQATHLRITAPAQVTSGQAFTLTVTALDADNNVATGYRGTVHFTSSDRLAVLPPDYTFAAADNGMHSFSGVRLSKAGSQTITGTDLNNGISGLGGVMVNPGPASQYILAGPTSVMACGSFSLNATAADGANNTDTNYNGTAMVTESPMDSGSMWLGQGNQGPPPWNIGFSSGQSSLGNPDIQAPCPSNDDLPLTVTYTFHQTSSPPPTISDASITITFNSGPFRRVHVTGPLMIPAGQAVNFIVTMTDDHGYRVRNYNGTVHFTSSDSQATLPADYTFNPTGDQGQHTFSAILRTAGPQTITVTDMGTGINGSLAITVTPGLLDHFGVTTSVDDGGTVAGSPFDVTVTAQDAYNNTVTNYTGTIAFSSQDPYVATLPSNYTFQPTDQGQATFVGGATLYTAGTWDVTVTDTATSATGSDFIGVTAAPAVAFQVIAPTTAASGTPFGVTVIAVDPYGNTDTNYTGTITWTSSDSDPGVILPADYTFQPTDAGMVTFPGGVTLITLGDQTITATDTNSGINGSTTVTVIPGPNKAQSRGKGSQRALDTASLDQMALDALFASQPAEGRSTRNWAALVAPARAHRGQTGLWADAAWWDDLP